jgi:oligopeptide/dipeptide ABC transporter ATP-binding protein
MIAMAIACGPELLIADEPTTALDVTIQREILELLDDLRHRRRMAMLHITHDLALIAERAHSILVMYAGRVVEKAQVQRLFERPAHPYTLGLLACRPRLGQPRERLPSIPGRVPEPADRPGGCAFHPRCPFALERCHREEPPLAALGDGHHAACWELERVLAEGRWPS